MKKTWGFIGTILFFAAWPLWFVYFKIWHQRTRVIVTSGSKVLLVKGWLAKNEWTLPGGGIKKSENISAAAARELHEETGIKINKSVLERLDHIKSGEYLLNYEAEIFLLTLEKLEQPRPRFPEILEVSWMDKAELGNLKLSKETRILLIKYL